ncbi:MAG TPA: hypothetical protein VGJ13_05055 [Pseudonocardiaceae bacterium]
MITRALTLHQPHATCVAYFGKPIENRPSRCHIRDRFAVHAGLIVDPVSARLARLLERFTRNTYPRGAVVAVANLAGCHRAHGCCAPWGEQGAAVWHWELRGVRPLATPVPCRGHQGWWTLPPEVAAAVAGQFEAVPA